MQNSGLPLDLTFLLVRSPFIGSNVFGFILAYFLNENIKAKGVVRAMFFIPNIVSAVLVSFIWVFILQMQCLHLAEH